MRTTPLHGSPESPHFELNDRRDGPPAVGSVRTETVMERRPAFDGDLADGDSPQLVCDERALAHAPGSQAEGGRGRAG
jgi:hypothetical protein